MTPRIEAGALLHVGRTPAAAFGIFLGVRSEISRFVPVEWDLTASLPVELDVSSSPLSLAIVSMTAVTTSLALCPLGFGGDGDVRVEACGGFRGGMTIVTVRGDLAPQDDLALDLSVFLRALVLLPVSEKMDVVARIEGGAALVRPALQIVEGDETTTIYEMFPVNATVVLGLSVRF